VAEAGSIRGVEQSTGKAGGRAAEGAARAETWPPGRFAGVCLVPQARPPGTIARA